MKRGEVALVAQDIGIGPGESVRDTFAVAQLVGPMFDEPFVGDVRLASGDLFTSGKPEPPWPELVARAK